MSEQARSVHWRVPGSASRPLRAACGRAADSPDFTVAAERAAVTCADCLAAAPLAEPAPGAPGIHWMVAGPYGTRSACGQRLAPQEAGTPDKRKATCPDCWAVSGPEPLPAGRPGTSGAYARASAALASLGVPQRAVDEAGAARARETFTLRSEALAAARRHLAVLLAEQRAEGLPRYGNDLAVRVALEFEVAAFLLGARDHPGPGLAALAAAWNAGAGGTEPAPEDQGGGAA